MVKQATLKFWRLYCLADHLILWLLCKWSSCCYLCQIPLVLGRCRHDNAQAFAWMKQIESIVDLFQLHGVSDILIHLESAVHVFVDKLGNIFKRSETSKRCPLPYTTCTLNYIVNIYFGLHIHSAWARFHVSAWTGRGERQLISETFELTTITNLSSTNLTPFPEN